jgi:hypothetical protein
MIPPAPRNLRPFGVFSAILIILILYLTGHAQTNTNAPTNVVQGAPPGADVPTFKTNLPPAAILPPTNPPTPALLNPLNVGTNWLVTYESYETNIWLPVVDEKYLYQLRVDWNVDTCLVRARDKDGKEKIFTNILGSNIVWKAEAPEQRHLLVFQTNADGATRPIGFVEKAEVFK